jgi:hypothetical protein
MAVLELATLPSLRRLSLVQLRKLTDNAVYFLSEHTPTLERLHLSHCDGLSLDSIHHAIRKLPELVHLSATGIPALVRPGVERFSEQPPQASSRYPTCHKITDAQTQRRTARPATRNCLGCSLMRELSCFAHFSTKRWNGNDKRRPETSSLCHVETMQKIYTDGSCEARGCRRVGPPLGS